MVSVSKGIGISLQCALAAEVGIAQDREPHLPTQSPLYRCECIQAK
jgi:hypothetical protein